jgi:hypothetical protein
MKMHIIVGCMKQGGMHHKYRAVMRFALLHTSYEIDATSH